MKICIQKSTGRMIEWQSDATEGTLIRNAINYGFDPQDIEERDSTQQELDSFLPKPEPKADRLQIVIDELAKQPNASKAILDLASADVISEVKL